MQTLPILALCLLAVAAALPATHGAACETKLPWSSSAQAFASPVRVKFQGYPTITLRPQAKGTVSGNVIISTPTVNGGCNYGNPLNSADPAVASAVAGATLKINDTIRVGDVKGQFGSMTGIAFVSYTVKNLEVLVSSNTPVGGRVNQRKSIQNINFQVLNGTADVYYRTNVQGKVNEGSKSFNLTDTSVTAKGCTLTARKATNDWFVNCNLLRAAFSKISISSLKADVWITVRGSSLTASAPLSDAALVA